jgi:dienelactone hydrolase
MDNTVYEYITRDLCAQRDGKRIYGMIYIPRNAGEKMPAVIYSHSFGETHQSGAQYANALASKGYVVYCYDFCGGAPENRSDGSPFEMSIFTERDDLRTVISMIRKLDYVDGDNIFLLGVSQGGVVSAITAPHNVCDIAGVVLLYPAFVLVEDVKKQFESPDKVPDICWHKFMTVGRAYFIDLYDYDIYSDIKGYDKDVLIIHGGADGIVPLSYSERAVQAYPSARLEVLSGAGHGFRGEDVRKAVDFILEYLNAHLK